MRQIEKVEIRPVGKDERADWEPLWQGYLAFYKASLSPEQNDLTWARLHDPAEPMRLIGAHVDGKPYFGGPRPTLRLVTSDRIGEDVLRLTYVPA